MTTSVQTKMMTIAETAELLFREDNYLIITHGNPDGDTCGSAAALCAALRSLGKRAFICPNPTITDRYVPFIADCLADDASHPSFFISVDIADPALFTENSVQYAGSIGLCIDHHPSNKLYAERTLLDPKAAACGEIILDLIKETGVEITRDIALPLYLAISTDTGCFRFSNTTPRTMCAAAELMETGIDFFDINTRFFETKSRTRLLIEQKISENIRYLDEGRTAIAVITRQLIADAAAKEEDVENISSFIRTIEGVQIAVLLRERGDELWKISVRTSESANASRICSVLGGGGHARAAGCTFTGTLEDAAAAIVKSIEMEKSADA